VFLSRVSPKKNIEFAIGCIAKLQGTVTLDVYGPFESAEYEARVRALAEGLDVRFHGPLSPALVPEKLREAHYFLFPTYGENFGHVVAESLAVGLPCVLSDTTPWSDIAECGAGWAIPLAQREEWLRVLQSCVGADGSKYSAQVENVKGYYSAWLVSNPCEGSEDVFRSSRPAA
jgi:glycosyltransferase involved in cell wall biosynthesis